MTTDKPQSRDTRDNRVNRVSDPGTTRDADVRPDAGIPPPSRVLTDVVMPHRDQAAAADGAAPPLASGAVDPDRWRDHHAARTDWPGAPPYETCATAYRFGAQERRRYGAGAVWDDAASILAHDWKAARGDCPLSWDEATPAIRAAWEGTV